MSDATPCACQWRFLHYPGEHLKVRLSPPAHPVLSSRETTDRPTCPTCGNTQQQHEAWVATERGSVCPDTFHSAPPPADGADRGKD